MLRVSLLLVRPTVVAVTVARLTTRGRQPRNTTEITLTDTPVSQIGQSFKIIVDDAHLHYRKPRMSEMFYFFIVAVVKSG